MLMGHAKTLNLLALCASVALIGAIVLGAF
jgi:hypothetical protein